MHSIELNALSFYREGKLLFENLDFKFPNSGLYLLSGDTGSGKSTLLRLIAGFSELKYEGNILIDNTDFSKSPMRTKAAKIGMIFQNPSQQFTMSTLRKELIFTLENLGLSKSEIGQRLEHSIEDTDVAKLLDNKLEYLSGGELQRAALSIVLAMQPDIILLDEPFASVDKKNRLSFIKKLKELALDGKLIIISDHELSDYENVADYLVRLERSKLSYIELSYLKNFNSEYILSSGITAKKSPLLRLENFSMKNSSKLLLEPCDFSFFSGINTLTGDNGVGKSSLFMALIQEHAYKGKIYLHDRPIKKYKNLYENISLIFQDASKQFVSVSVKDELEFSPALSDYSKKKQKEALAHFGFDKLLHRSVYSLSGGQQKLLQLIIMLSLELPVNLLDEPFTGLDEASSAYVMDWIGELAKENSFIIISHRLSPLHNKSDHHIIFKDRALSYGGRTNDQKK